MEEGLISFADDGSLQTKLSIERLEILGLRHDMELSLPLTERQKGWMTEHRNEHGFKEAAKHLSRRHRMPRYSTIDRPMPAFLSED
jgi:hypothetical protein